MLLYDSLSQTKKEIKPLIPNKILMYVCGITPYDTTHLGHAFVYVTSDVLFRYLKYKGYEVNYTQNVTDIDDDILRKAKEGGVDWIKLGDFWTNKFLSDLKNLNVLSPTHYVKATNSIDNVIKIVLSLVKRGYAYEVEGTVFYDVSKFPQYGGLSRYNEKQMALILSERGGNPKDSRKRNPLDFILWQNKKDDEPSWKSPWGLGRPGWHIECSSMIDEYLGSQIDIHGGGRDLIFPHHESEIAQSESYTAKSPFVGHWMHEAMVMYQGEKMSKSLGNLVLISELLLKYSANEIRWFLLSHHYREVWEYHEEEFGDVRRDFELVSRVLPKKEEKVEITEIEKIIEDDLNTPDVLQFVIELAKEVEKNDDNMSKLKILKTLKLLGFDLTNV